MTLALNAEQHELRAMLRDFCTDHSSEAAVRATMSTPDGWDVPAWRQLGELGICGLAVPERFGGSGAGVVELGVAAEELGRTLACVPFLSTSVLGASVLLESGDEAAQTDLLPGIATGTGLVAVASAETAEHWLPAVPQVHAEITDGGWVLSGAKQHVLDGHIASTLLVLASTATGSRLFAVDAAAAGVERSAPVPLDLTRRLADVTLRAVLARPLGAAGTGLTILERAGQVASAVLAAEQVGGARRVLELTVEYATTRQQFGRAIGSFQAIKHACAQMLLEVESATSAAYHALWAATNAPDELPMAASVARVYCSEVFSEITYRSVQIFGGIGFTWEHPVHLYLKRAAGSRQLLGDPTQHREAVAAALALVGEAS